MASLRVFTFLLVAALVQYSFALSKCDPNVIDQISGIWKQIGVPKSVIKTAAESKKENIIATTLGYYPADTKCSYAELKPDYLYLTVLLKSGKSIVEKETLAETPGLVTETAPEGKHEGGIKVKSGPSFDTSVVKKAIGYFNNLGFPLADFYPSQC